jgi:hypothetical protein
MIDRESDCIPEFRDVLPLVQQSWTLPLQQFGYLRSSRHKILLMLIWIINVQNALRMLLACRRFATPLGTFYQNRADIRQLFGKNPVNYSFAIFVHLALIISHLWSFPQLSFGNFSVFRSAVFPFFVRQFG